MRMYFSFGTDALGDFIFKGWEVQTPGQFVGAFFTCIAFGFLLESIGFIDWVIFKKTPPLESESLIGSKQEPRKTPLLIESIAFLFSKFLVYIMMIAVMSYNFWLLIACCLGTSAAGFIFDIVRDRDFINKRREKH